MRERRCAGDKALVAVFLVLICLPLPGLIFGFDRAFRARRKPESGRPARAEARPRRRWRRFQREFEAYFNDQFGFRKRLIHWLAVAKVQGLGVTSTPGVILGSNGWLYLASDAAVSSYRATRPFTPEQLEAYRQIIEAQARLAGRARNPVCSDHPAEQGHDLSGIHARCLQQGESQVAARSARRLHERAFKRTDPRRSGRPATSQAG